jgi:hypothetical protein
MFAFSRSLLLQELSRKRGVSSMPATPRGRAAEAISEEQLEKLVSATRSVLAVHAPATAGQAKDSIVPDGKGERVEWAARILEVAAREVRFTIVQAWE